MKPLTSHSSFIVPENMSFKMPKAPVVGDSANRVRMLEPPSELAKIHSKVSNAVAAALTVHHDATP